jgi:hypothetical protein
VRSLIIFYLVFYVLLTNISFHFISQTCFLYYFVVVQNASMSPVFFVFLVLIYFIYSEIILLIGARRTVRSPSGARPSRAAILIYFTSYIYVVLFY